MMAPHFERARMLCEAIDIATHELSEPIDRIDVRQAHVLIWAGGKRLKLRCSYANSYGPDGSALLGGGSWVAEVVKIFPSGPPRFLSWLKRRAS